MTKQEIQALIDAKINGQGNQVDIGGALATILSALTAAAVPIEVEDITALTGEQLDSLNDGDKVIKVTGKQKHTYIVSYKGDGVGEGLCLTYTDASVVETVSYDHTDSGWVYNSTDKTFNTPLIVEGTMDFDNLEFTPAAGQPSLADAYAAYISGREVILRGGSYCFSVAGADDPNDGNSLYVYYRTPAFIWQ